MTIKLTVYLWIISAFVALVILFIYGPAILINKLRKSEVIHTKNTYSYYKPIKLSIITSFVASLVSLLIFAETKSVELSITFFVFFIVCIISGLLRTLVNQRNFKQRGATEE